MTPAEAEAGRAALREFRRYRRGAVLADARPFAIRFVTDPESGAVVAPVERAVLDADELVLFVPEERDESLQALIEPIPGAVPEALIDRWRIHHGDPPATVGDDPADAERAPMRWARFEIEGVRLGGALIEGDALMTPNPLAAVEPKVCKRLNADRRLLWQVCKMKTGVDVPADVSGGPVCVAVDPGGLHVRGKMGVLRVEFDREAQGADAPAVEGDAMSQIEALLSRAGRP